MQTKTVRVLRKFYFERRLLTIGEIVELPSIFADEMCAATKAELVDHAAEGPPPPDVQVDPVSLVGEAEPPKPPGRKERKAHAE